MIKIIKKYANSKNLKVLDIGCGTVKYGELMKEAGCQVVGIDKSESQINQARYPDVYELKKELSMFSEIEIEHSSIVIKKSKERYLNQYKKRGTSNLSFLTDFEIEEGIKKFEEDYKNEELIEKITKNTFVVARKKELL